MKRSSLYPITNGVPRRIECRQWADTYTRRVLWAIPAAYGTWATVQRRHPDVTYTGTSGEVVLIRHGEHMAGAAWRTPAAIIRAGGQS